MSNKRKKLKIGGEYWYFNGVCNPRPVRIVQAPYMHDVSGSVKVRDRNGTTFVTINDYIYRNHEVVAAVADHADDLSTWAEKNSALTNGDGLDHKVEFVPLGLMRELEREQNN